MSCRTGDVHVDFHVAVGVGHRVLNHLLLQPLPRPASSDRGWGVGMKTNGHHNQNKTGKCSQDQGAVRGPTASTLLALFLCLFAVILWLVGPGRYIWQRIVRTCTRR